MLITFAIYYSIIKCGNQIYLCLAIKLSSEIGTTFSSLVAFLAVLTIFFKCKKERDLLFLFSLAVFL